MQDSASRSSISYHRSERQYLDRGCISIQVSTFMGTVKVKIKAERSHSLQLGVWRDSACRTGQGRAGHHRSRKDTLKDTYNWFGKGSTQKDTWNLISRGRILNVLAKGRTNTGKKNWHFTFFTLLIWLLKCHSSLVSLKQNKKGSKRKKKWCDVNGYLETRTIQLPVPKPSLIYRLL